jgi:hypothetical protein
MPDTIVPKPDDARFWGRARTLGDLGRLTARWLEGEITYQPAWEGPPDAETEDILPALAEVNRGGFVTHFSQPGEPTELRGAQQRAAVSGFCDNGLLTRIQQATLATDVVLLAYPPGASFDGLQIPVSLSQGRAWRWAGATMRAVTIRDYYSGDCHSNAVEALCDAWQATLLDPHWGRNDLLWDRLLAAVGRESHSPPSA